MWQTIMTFFSGLFGSVITSIAEKVTWRRIIVLAIFGGTLAMCGSLLWSVGSVLVGTLRSIAGANLQYSVADKSGIFYDMLNFMPVYVRFILYNLGADWILFLAISVGNFYLLQICFRRFVKWGVSVVSAIYNTL